MLEFIIGLLIALSAGQVEVSQASAVSSADSVPFEQTAFNWPCGDETCFLIIDPAGIHTGP